MTRGRVVLVPFPFDDRSRTKVRPAVCLSEPVGPFRQITVAFVTSQTPLGPLPTDLTIRTDDAGFEATGLRTTSTIRLHRLLTVGAESIVSEIGVLSPRLLTEMTDRLRLLFSL